jgi:hypothetical protein
MTKPTITAWLKTYCGWSNGIRAVLAKYDLPYEEKDIIKNPAFRWEMEQTERPAAQPLRGSKRRHARRHQRRRSGALPPAEQPRRLEREDDGCPAEPFMQATRNTKRWRKASR